MLEALLTEFNNCFITRSRKQSVIFTQQWSQEGGKCRFINEQNIINFVGSYFICRSRGELSANKKEEKFASNVNKPCLYSNTSWKILQHWGLAWYGIELLKHARHLGKSEEEDMPLFFGQPSPWSIYIKDSATCPCSLRYMGAWVQAAAKLYALTMWMTSLRVRTRFWPKKPSVFQGHSGTHFQFFKDSIQCKKEPWVYVFFSSSPTWAILSERSFCVRWVG